MSILILVRHGQSTWNLEKRFTGWVDVDLTEIGKSEAEKAGLLVKNRGIEINFYYSSFQLRANHTLKIIQRVLNKKKNFTRAWQLNERHYGALTGLNKIEMANTIGKSKVHEFRRSWDVKPEPLNKEDPNHPLNITTYNNVPKEKIPDTESLKDTYERVLKYFEEEQLICKHTGKKCVLIASRKPIRDSGLAQLKNKEGVSVWFKNPILYNVERLVESAEKMDRKLRITFGRIKGLLAEKGNIMGCGLKKIYDSQYQESLSFESFGYPRCSTFFNSIL